MHRPWRASGERAGRKAEMRLAFTKMSGAGNDFIVVDNRDGSLDEVLTPALIRRMCSRGISVGADGLLELRADPEADFRMRYCNSDGLPASMCGNGARCIVRFAVDRGLGKGGSVVFRSDSGTHRGLLGPSGAVRVWMPDPVLRFLSRRLAAPSGERECSLVDTGVPHAVIFAADPGDGFEVDAPVLRRHEAFGPEGANIDYVFPSDGSLGIRTWERGVEGETLACGTGAVAVAFVASMLDGAALPVELVTRGGGLLSVGRDDRGWWLEGEARKVYTAELVDV